MISGIRAILSAISGIAIGVLITVLCYEGIPIIRSIPFIGSYASGIIAGRVEIALDGYVRQAEKTAIEAQLSETKRQLNAGAQALEEYRRRQEAAETLSAEEDIRHETEIATYVEKLRASGRNCRIDDADVDFLLRQ